MPRFTKKAEDALRKAGWFPGRRVDVTAWRASLENSGLVIMHDVAEEFLSEFGGMSFEEGGPGITRYREAFVLDPLLQLGNEDVFSYCSEVIDGFVFPIGDLDDRWPLGIGEDGVIYSKAGDLTRFAPGVAGFEELILGVMPTTVPEDD